MDCVVFDPPYMHSPGGPARVDIKNGLTAQGFTLTDLFVLVRQSRPGVSRMVRRIHARTNHPYFPVFTKPRKTRGMGRTQ